MCGIAGILRGKSGDLDMSVITELSNLLHHRGPDNAGYLVWGNKSGLRLARDFASYEGAELCLAHRRLSILDLSEAGWQPMGTPDGRHFIVFNGEIYNYLELRRELETLGHSF